MGEGVVDYNYRFLDSIINKTSWVGVHATKVDEKKKKKSPGRPGGGGEGGKYCNRQRTRYSLEIQ